MTAAKTMVNESTTYMPRKEDRSQLINIKNSLTKSLAKSKTQQKTDAEFTNMTQGKDFPIPTISVPGKSPIPLTKELADVLVEVASQLSRGKAVMVAPCSTELTTQAAADMLGISRPTFVKLLENKEIPYRKVGRHRRVLLTDLQKYMQSRHEAFVKDFKELAKDTNLELTFDNPLIRKKRGA
ncbi:helix-turn-helix domain-containing protein [Bifidobacterium sp. ESL0763]|uniref:helix-turn-helix domain-containing protein n=1 Tax=Bifidobacterium sp. ESL0763 TaxID=2983227 RepID=UPI0023F78B7E|nr:helix-turn-helix domain-containing protein [Bifidobacterium sp. ESL0763]MDF7663549.1 helix-turn-helix domain-containing protein [Bifidobacterium sp. ESL0763]